MMEAEPTQPDAQRRILPLAPKVFWAAMVLAGIPGLVILFLTITSVQATDLAPLSQQFSGFEVLPEPGEVGGPCGLNQRAGVSGCEAFLADEIIQEEIQFESSIAAKGIPRLTGTLTRPSGAQGPRPTVLLVHGSGPMDRHLTVPGDLVRKLPEPFALFDSLSELLARQGFNVLAYDKRSCGACYGEASFDPLQFSFEDFETDALDALGYLRSRPEVDSERLVLLGVSQGGGMVNFIANRAEGVVAVVSLAGLFESFGPAMIQQLDRISEVRRSQWDYIGPFNIYLQKSKLEGCMAKLDGPGYRADEVCIGGGVTQQALKAYNQRSALGVEELKRLKVPAFLAQGTLDRNISPELFQGLPEQLKGRQVELHFIEGMDHSLTEAIPSSAPEAASPGAERAAGLNKIHPELLQRLTAFFGRVRP